jgi:hypothetical protein
MSALLFPFMLIAAVGFVSSAAAHIASLAGVQPPGGGLVWSLHIGIFVVWIPTVLVATRITGGTDRKDFWKLVLSGCPAWMRQAGYVLFAYAILNFIWYCVHYRRCSKDARPSSVAIDYPRILRTLDGILWSGVCYALFGHPRSATSP